MNNANQLAALLTASALVLASCATAPTEQQAGMQMGHQHQQEMAPMHGNMQQMQELMAKIHATQDPAERQRLMTEHRAAMRAQMQAMHGMMNQSSCPMMSGGQGMGRGGMMGGKQGGAMGDSAQHQCAMMGHMQMMHGMMEQMLEQMSVEQGDKPAADTEKQQEHVH